MEKEITSLTKNELTNNGFLKSIYENYPNSEERQVVLDDILKEGAKYNITGKLKKEMIKCNSEFGSNNTFQTILITGSDGTPEITTENYISIMNNDEKIKNLFHYDEFIKQIIYTKDGKTRWWTDRDDSILKAYIEKEYGIYNQQKYYDAFNTVLSSRAVHPIKNIIEEEQWDGVPRIDNFLTNVLGCEGGDYSREVSRMIFYGGINRLYHPGCKFDYMPILIGSQGCGKSSIVSWLALKDNYYKDVPSIEGKDGMESLDGVWICEMAELLAMVRIKDVEAMKAYISRTSDKYRKSYDRRVSDNPRQCIFIGTTNDNEFLIDKTGNRRYLPVQIHIRAEELYRHKGEIKKYILYCWREALELMKNEKTYLSIDPKYMSEIEKQQKNVMMDDPRVGLILEYLNKQEIGARVSGIELFTKCINGLKKNYNMGEAKEISRIMSGMPNWEKCDKRFFTSEYGQQRGWIKIDGHKRDDIKKVDISSVVDVKDDSKWDDLD